MQMILILNELLIHIIRLHPVGTMTPREERDEVVLELRGVVRDVAAGVLADGEHLPEVRLGRGVALEAVLVPALFFAHLAVPAEPLEALGLHFVGDVFGGAD